VNLLAFDTSTDILSIAVQASGPGAVPFEYCGAGGARASCALIPVAQDLLTRAGIRLADVDAIVFGRGPGSFTGLRTACSVAQGLAFGAGIEVLAVDTLLAVAEDAHHREGVEKVVAVLDARMDEVYSAAYVRENGHWLQQGNTMLGAPERVTVSAGFGIAGNAFAAYGARLPSASVRIDAMPTAAALLRLAPILIAAGQAGPAASATPLYIRDKVAQTTAERVAARVARLQS
jgi:tRNA threonylcarbamoyladenosine biosynthesis protein TsaB